MDKIILLEGMDQALTRIKAKVKKEITNLMTFTCDSPIQPVGGANDEDDFRRCGDCFNCINDKILSNVIEAIDRME